MIQRFYNFLGYTGDSELIAAICSVGAIILVVCLAYSFIQFLFDLVFSFIKTKRK